MQSPPPSIDPISLFVAVASGLVGPTLAPLIGTYSVILLAASTGAGWALSRRDPGLKVHAAWFLFRINATALLLTVAIAEGTQRWFSLDSMSWLLAPIALGVGAIGDDWPAIGRWLITRFGRAFERRTGTGDQP